MKTYRTITYSTQRLVLHYSNADHVTFSHACHSSSREYSRYSCSQEKAATFLQTYRPIPVSVGEKKFYDALLAALDSTRYLIFAKVRIADIIETNLDRADPMYWKKLAPINQKHIDFILVSRSDTTPRVAIELDGGSHSDKQRLKRDAFVDSVFHNAGIPLLHIPVKSFYQYNELRSAIETVISKAADFRKSVL